MMKAIAVDVAVLVVVAVAALLVWHAVGQMQTQLVGAFNQLGR